MPTVDFFGKRVQFGDGTPLGDIEDVLGAYKAAAEAVGETAMTMGSAAVAEPIAGLTGLATGDVDAIGGMMERMTYQPRTEAGQKAMTRISESLQSGMETIGADHLPGYWRDRVVPALQDNAGPIAGSALAAAGLAATVGLMEVGGLKGSRAARMPGNQVGAIGDPDIKELQFLHNTSADKLGRIESMGGMPMPSLAVTKDTIPFDGFGDITLVGKPDSFDPKANKLNQAFSADAYTVRAPSPVRVAKKGAGKRFSEKFKDSGVYTDETISNIWDLERKGDVNESMYTQVVNFFDRGAGEELFAKERGIDISKDSYETLKPFRESGEFQSWRDSQLNEIFEPEEYFIANPDRDYYAQSARLKPYSAEEVAKFMKKSSGRNAEGGMASNSTAGVRASTTEDLKSLQAMRDRKESLVSSENMAEFKQTSDMMLDDLQEAFKPFYKYEQGGWGYGDEFREMVRMSESKGLNSALSEIGFDNVPDDLIAELNDYKNLLRSAPTEYFEAKPKRVVDLSEFGGAIVPENTGAETLDLLSGKGLQVERYSDEASRVAARQRFKELMFQLAPVAPAVGVIASQPDEKSQ